MGQRVASVDVFRGLTIAAMILVNSPGPSGALFSQLQHADWDGWTLADLVFPFFLFIVGITTAFTVERWRDLGLSRRAAVWRILRRATVLVCIGLIGAGFPNYDWAAMRLPGILQRIGIVYLCIGLLTLVGGRRVTIAALATVLVGYSVLMTRLVVPDTDGLRAAALLADPVNNMAATLDRRMLGDRMDADEPVDPEGPTSTLSATGTGLLGVLAGRWLISRRRFATRALGLAIAGSIACWLGVWYGGVVPINKQLWSSSFVLLSGGSAALALCACMLMVDRRAASAWTRPFRHMGENPLLLYVGSSALYDLLDMTRVTHHGAPQSLQLAIYKTLFGGVADPRVGSLAYASLFLLLALVTASVLHRKSWSWRP